VQLQIANYRIEIDLSFKSP